MSKAGTLLTARILAEFEDIEITVERALHGWERAKNSNLNTIVPKCNRDSSEK
jgi:hypothetical protein